MNRSDLPDSITLPTGEVLKPVIGGRLGRKIFPTKEHSGVDVTQNGWAGPLLPGEVDRLIINEAKRRQLKYRTVKILSGNLKHRLDLRGYPYRPTGWIFVDVNCG